MNIFIIITPGRTKFTISFCNVAWCLKDLLASYLHTNYQLVEEKQSCDLSRSRIEAAWCTLYLELVSWPLGVPADPWMHRACIILDKSVTAKQLRYNIKIAHYDTAAETKSIRNTFYCICSAACIFCDIQCNGGRRWPHIRVYSHHTVHD